MNKPNYSYFYVFSLLVLYATFSLTINGLILVEKQAILYVLFYRHLVITMFFHLMESGAN